MQGGLGGCSFNPSLICFRCVASERLMFPSWPGSQYILAEGGREGKAFTSSSCFWGAFLHSSPSEFSTFFLFRYHGEKEGWSVLG